MVIDFALQKPAPAVKKTEPPAPAPMPGKRPITPEARQAVMEKEPPPQPEVSPGISPAPEVPPAGKPPESRSLESRPMGMETPGRAKASQEGSPGIAGNAKEGSGTGAGMGHTDGGREAARKKYLNDHFAYIKDKILRNVSYPDAARRMGWQGKVVLSFAVAADGSVRAFRIIQSSGFSLLDRNAVETVKDAAPFPKPPEEAQIVISIIYRLD
jgi:protein TonB